MTWGLHQRFRFYHDIETAQEVQDLLQFACVLTTEGKL